MAKIIDAIATDFDSFAETCFDSIHEEGLNRAWIIKFLGATAQNFEANQQFEVVLAIFYHLVDELYARGCCKSEICTLAKLTAQYWQNALDRTLQENLRNLNSNLVPLVPHPVSERTAEIYLKYMVSSFLQHFHLYRVCLSVSHPDARLRRGVTVEAPDVPVPLREGRRPEEHEYHCHLKEIETEEQLARGVQISRRLEEAAKLASREREVEGNLETAAVAEEQEYPNSLIGDCVELNLRQLRLKVLDMAESSSIDLIYKAKRTAVPRPSSLGPPPRFTASTGGGGGGVGAAADKKSAGSSRRSSAKSKSGGDTAKRAAKVK